MISLFSDSMSLFFFVISFLKSILLDNIASYLSLILSNLKQSYSRDFTLFSYDSILSCHTLHVNSNSLIA